VREHLQQAHHREVAHVGHERCAFGREPVPAETEDREARIEQPQLADQLGGVQLAGGLAAADQETHVHEA
jgi:hypothetical protein